MCVAVVLNGEAARPLLLTSAELDYSSMQAVTAPAPDEVVEHLSGVAVLPWRQEVLRGGHRRRPLRGAGSPQPAGSARQTPLTLSNLGPLGADEAMAREVWSFCEVYGDYSTAPYVAGCAHRAVVDRRRKPTAARRPGARGRTQCGGINPVCSPKRPSPRRTLPPCAVPRC